jgi:HSP20 family molecular chaperone IbpA
VLTDSQGRWVVAGLPSGNYKAQVQSPGFNSSQLNLNYDASQPSMYNFRLNLGGVSELVEVTAEAPQVNATSSSVMVYGNNQPRGFERPKALPAGVVGESASANVVNLQKRVAGVLPVAIDVPRAGTSFSFVRPLVLDEETKVTFSYKSR